MRDSKKGTGTTRVQIGLQSADSGAIPHLRGQLAGPRLAPGRATTGDGMGVVNSAPTPSGAVNRAPT
jgi:hypothetical protein